MIFPPGRCAMALPRTDASIATEPPMSRALTFPLTLLAMLAFAGNSLLCRLALKDTGIDAASFTSIRIVSGALMLWLIVRLRDDRPSRRLHALPTSLRGVGSQNASGSWWSAFALFAYAACFSFAYVSLPAATGALLLFGAVQATMIGYGLWAGERMGMRQSAGLLCASAGLVGLMLPGVAAPPPVASVLMLVAGAAWGMYSLRGKGVADPTTATMGNFLRAIPFAIALSAMAFSQNSVDRTGICYAIASGALTSGVGYAIWYTALRGLKATRAAVVQLSVPMFAAIGGIAFLGESISLRLLIASAAILGGIALVIVERTPNAPRADR
jgi:drug/metabolite transporter (DMT)-like permease